MNSESASQFMDKQVMDPSDCESHDGGGESDFIDFENHTHQKKDGILPSYDFMPIRPTAGSSSPPNQTNRSVNFDSAEDDASVRARNSPNSKTNASPIRNYGSLDVDKSSKAMDLSLVSEIDKAVKKYTDNLKHAMDNVSARISQLETRTRSLENSMDDLKVSIGNNHGGSDGKMRQMENILREVETGLHVVREKQDLFEAQMQTPKAHFSEFEHVKIQDAARSEAAPPPAPPPSALPSLNAPPPPQNAPPPPPPQQHMQPQVPFPSQYPQNHFIPVPQPESYFPTPSQVPEKPSLPYPGPPPHHHQPPPPQPQHHHPPPPQPEYSQPPPPPEYYQPPPPSQPHPSYSATDPSLSQMFLANRFAETPYPTPQTYPSGIRPPPPSEQFYDPTRNVYESSPPGSGYSNPHIPSSGHIEPYPYNSPPQYNIDSPRKHQQISSTSGYPQLPTARILPQAIPTASTVGSGSGSGSGSPGNKVPIDDVIDKVTHMGFSRDQVRATVRKLTENGQTVDLNVVLDKLMNDGNSQAPRGWFGR